MAAPTVSSGFFLGGLGQSSNPIVPMDILMSEEQDHDRATTKSGDIGPTVSVLIVSYNTREMTLECLRSVVSETPELDYEVLVLDNCSTDGSFEAMIDEFGDRPGFTIEHATENLGFAGGNNLLAETARGEYLLLLNPDTVVLDRAIECLVEFARSTPENGIWGGRTIFEDGSLNPTNCWGPFTVWSEVCAAFGLRAAFPKSRLFHPRGYGRWKRDSVREVGVVTGCFLLMRLEDWRSFGGFDPEFFMYGEETDLCMRAIKKGLRPVVTPSATIVHHGGASEKVRTDKMVRLFDAQIRLFRRHFSRMGFRVVHVSMNLGVLMRALLMGVVGRIPGKPRKNDWAEMWRRREEWSAGAKGTRLSQAP